MADLIPPLKPSRSYGFLSVAVVAVAAIIALAAAWGALVAVERTSQNAVEHALFLGGEDWADVEVNGLQVILSGDAPSEAARFAALSAAGREVDGARVIDQMVLPEAVAIVPPRFSIEMLRNEAGISLIGLIPAETDRDALTERMRTIDPIHPVADFLETAEFPTPDGWEDTLDFSLEVAGMLPRSKISMDAARVTVEAIAPSPEEKREWELQIRQERPAGLRLALDIRAPLDVVSPYIVRFLSDAQGARFDACTAYTPADRKKIISAGVAAGVTGTVDCTIGLGVPSPDWPDAVARGIRAVSDMGGGSLTFSDADVTLIAPSDTPQDTFDRVSGELEADLPDVFSLHAVLTEPETGEAAPAGPPEFTATLGDDGAVQVRGRVASEQDRTIVETLARARFGTKQVYAPLRLDPALPASWAVRTLAGLEALDQLAHGRVVVRPDLVTVSGTTGDKGASAEISRLLSEKLGDAQDFRVNVKYEESLDPVAALPTPQECVADVNAALAQNKITFAPGSAEIERASLPTVDKIADTLKSCSDVAMEIGGYTDSQGREEMNQALSQRRAEAVVSALLARRVLTTNLKAFGYGEDNPIADNDTEEGREANRRIEFSLIGEDRPRAEVVEGDAPTIRPPTRPGTETSTGDDEAETEEPAAEPDAKDIQAAAPDAVAEATTADDTGETAPDVADDPAAETQDEGATDDAVEPETPNPDADPQTDAPEAVTETETVAGTEVEASAGEVETALEVGGESGSEDVAAVTETVDPPVGEEDTVGDTTQSTAEAEAPDAEVPDAATDATPDATPDVTPDVTTASEESATDEASPGPADEATETTAALEQEPATEDTTPEAAVDTAPEGGAAEPTDDADVASDRADALSVAAATQTAEPAAEEVADAIEAQGAGSATEAVATTAEPEAAEQVGVEDAAEAGTPAAETTDIEAAETTAAEAEAAGDETSGAETDADATAPAVTAPSDIPAIRPLPRPPIVVDPDLEGVRPKPRPADIPDAPTTAPTTE